MSFSLALLAIALALLAIFIALRLAQPSLLDALKAKAKAAIVKLRERIAALISSQTD